MFDVILKTSFFLAAAVAMYTFSLDYKKTKSMSAGILVIILVVCSAINGLVLVKSLSDYSKAHHETGR